jgi:hypothetical protein
MDCGTSFHTSFRLEAFGESREPQKPQLPCSRHPCKSLPRKYCGCYCVSGLFVLGSSLRLDRGRTGDRVSVASSLMIEYSRFRV